MVSKETWRAVATTLLVVALLSTGLWARTQWGNDDRTCWDGDVSRPCTAAENAAADMAAHAMGDLILAYIAVLMLAAATAAFFAMRPRTSSSP